MINSGNEAAVRFGRRRRVVVGSVDAAVDVDQQLLHQVRGSSLLQVGVGVVDRRLSEGEGDGHRLDHVAESHLRRRRLSGEDQIAEHFATARFQLADPAFRWHGALAVLIYAINVYPALVDNMQLL